MKKKIRFDGNSFTIEELTLVLDKIKEGLDEDTALINDDFTLSVILTITDEEIVVSKVNNLIK